MNHKQIKIKGIQFCECGLPITGKGWQRESKDIICNSCYDKEKPIIEKPIIVESELETVLLDPPYNIDKSVSDAEKMSGILYEHQIELRLNRIYLNLEQISLNTQPTYISDYNCTYVKKAKSTGMYNPSLSNSFQQYYVNNAMLTSKQYSSVKLLEKIFALKITE